MVLKNFAKNNSGVAFVTLALLIPIFFAVVAAAVDFNSLQKTYSLTQGATDSSSLAAADYIAKFREEEGSDELEVPSISELSEYALKNLQYNFDKKAAGSARLLPDSFSTEIIDVTEEYIDVKVAACAETKFFIADVIKKNTTCADSTARINMIPVFRNMEIAFSFEADYDMGGGSTRKYFGWTFFGNKHTKGILPEYFKSTEYMKENNIFVSLIPFTEKMNIFPYNKEFIENYTVIEDKNYGDLDPEKLMSNYPILTNDKFEELLSSDTTVKYPSFYDVFRLDKDDEGNRGKIYEDNPNLVMPLEYKVSGNRTDIYMIPNTHPGNHNDEAVSIQIHNAFFRGARRAYQDVIETKYIQPLTFSYEAVDGFLRNFIDVDYNINNGICHASAGALSRYREVMSQVPKSWKTPDPLEDDVPENIKQSYKNKYLNCDTNVNAYGEIASAPNWMGFWWAWQTLDEKNMDKWALNSFHEDLAKAKTGAEVPNGNRFGLSSPERKKILIHFNIGEDRSLGGRWGGFGDSYVNLDTSSHPTLFKALKNDIFQKHDDTETQVNFSHLSVDPSNTTSYQRLCDAIKETGVEIYIIDYLDVINRPIVHEQIKSCASSPEHFIPAGIHDVAGKIDGIFSKYSQKNIIKLIE